MISKKLNQKRDWINNLRSVEWYQTGEYPGLSMGMGIPWEMSHGMGWYGTARIAFPMVPMGQ